MNQLTRPRRLQSGDKIAAVSPSWGGPAKFPARYRSGKRQFEQTFGVTVVEMPHTLADAEFIAANPRARADDLTRAFTDPDIAGIVTTIGGDDSIRLIPYLDLKVIRANPKIFLGFSDTTALHFACLSAGLGSFYGPSIMAGFAENGGIHDYTITSVRKTLFSGDAVGRLPENKEGWTAERLDWGRPELQSQRRRLQPSTPLKLLQGRGIVSGHLIGGCAEVIEMIKGTAWWPDLETWRGAVLFYETSEEAPPAHLLRYWLRNFAAQGILGVLSGILLARPDPKGHSEYEREIETVVVEAAREAELPDLPIISGLDFGHTQPMLTLPYGVQARIDSQRVEVSIEGSGVVDLA